MTHPPDQSRPDVPRWFTVLIVVAGLAASFHNVPFSVMISADVWSNYELSNTVGRDFYRQNTARSFETDHPYSLAFPPLWPVSLWAGRQIVDLGVVTGVVLAGIATLLLAFALARLARRLGLPTWVGTATFLTLLSATVFNDELQAGRSIPLSVALFVATLATLAHNGRWVVPTAGLLMGLASLNRFDAMPVAAAVGLGVIILTWRRTRSVGSTFGAALLYGAFVLVALSPWMVYCQARFGKPLASDNTRQLCRAQGGHVTEFFDVPPANDLRDNFPHWLAGLVRVKGPKIVLASIGGIKNSSMPLIFAALAVIACARGKPALPAGLKRFLVYGPPLAVMTVAGCLLVGYGEGRYFSLAYAVLALILNGLLCAWAPGWTTGRACMYLVVLLLLPVYRLADQRYTEWRERIRPTPVKILYEPSAEMRAVSAAVEKDSAGRPHRLLITPAALATAYGALTGEPTTLLPNLDHGTLSNFTRLWKVTHVYDEAGLLSTVDTKRLRLVALDVPYLYRIEYEP
ncbi:MAG: hypothetical protein K1X57_06890 [Gemmataceae bacterium]|nr:hypothetical protein [Gemmataceae bacterium]